MKLRTEMVGPDSTSEGPYPAARVTDDGQDYLRDAAAAHALMQAIANKRMACSDREQHDVCVALDTVIRYADEIMTGLDFDSGEDA